MFNIHRGHLVGGLLGTAGGSLSDVWLTFVRQTGMALVLTLMLWVEEKRSSDVSLSAASE
jgi:hypothetical protein